MPDLLENPLATTARKGFFTSENARSYAIKGNQARWQNPKSLPKADREPLRVAEPDERLSLVLEQIKLTRDALQDKIEPKDRAQLVRALCGLLDRERILRGEPLPGSRKPAPERREPRNQDTGPLTPTLPSVAPATTMQPPKPLGWEYDNPTGTCSCCGE